MEESLVVNHQQRIFCWLVGLILCCCLTSVCIASSIKVLVLNKGIKKVQLKAFLEYLPEPDSRLTFKQVSSRRYANAFRPVGNVNHGFVSTPYWLRFYVDNKSNTEILRLLEISFPFLDYITLYEPVGNGSYRIHRTGRALPFNTREIKHRNFIFTLHIPPGIHPYFIRIETESAMYFPMTLWEEHAFWKADHEAQFILGLYYGIILVMALYNFFIFLSLKDRAYLFYVIYIACFALYQMTANGLAYEYLWPDATWWNRKSTIFFTATAMALAILFTKNFLSSKKAAPRLDKVLSIIVIASIIIAVLSFFVDYGLMLKVTLAVVAAFVTFMIVTGVVCLRRGQRSARFFLLAWFAILAGVMVLILWNIGWLPTCFFSIYSIQIGSVLDVVLLSLALADRINELRSSREQAMQEAMIQRIKAERQREDMVRELHDGIGAISSNIIILAEKARLLGPPKEVDRDLQIISELAATGRKEIAFFMECLDDGDQKAKDFIFELRHLGNRILESNDIELRLDAKEVKGDVKLSPFLRINILKTFQEALTNVVKHAGASKVNVEVSVDDRNFLLCVRDNGCGFIKNRQKAGHGRGISNMKKRAENLGGQLNVINKNGIEIKLIIPLREIDKKDVIE